ncbi:MAG TPA: XRE family transcriptional regulator [Gaiellaceae bacterium]|jgi:transcriptional regulator with XRE-family HTH domain|nr:XRE family transcriptional regulator [Gaiellaceae bacterium]
MSGHTKFGDLKHKPSREKIAAADRELERALTLAELRRAREMTQTQLASALEMKQGGVSRIEHQTDLYVSTLRSFIEALGGQLEVTAVFPDGLVPIRDFADLDEPVPA